MREPSQLRAVEDITCDVLRILFEAGMGDWYWTLSPEDHNFIAARLNREVKLWQPPTAQTAPASAMT